MLNLASGGGYRLAGVSVLDLDPTFLIQLVVFVLVFLLLKRLLFKPVLALIEERRERTVKMQEEAERLRSEAEKNLRRSDQKLAEARAASLDEAERVRLAVWNAEQEMLARSRQEAGALVEKSRQEMAKEVERLRTELLGEVETFGRSIASKLLERDVGSDPRSRKP